MCFLGISCEGFLFHQRRSYSEVRFGRAFQVRWDERLPLYREKFVVDWRTGGLVWSYLCGRRENEGEFSHKVCVVAKKTGWHVLPNLCSRKRVSGQQTSGRHVLPDLCGQLMVFGKQTDKETCLIRHSIHKNGTVIVTELMAERGGKGYGRAKISHLFFWKTNTCEHTFHGRKSAVRVR